jgi:hypothetical protein
MTPTTMTSTKTINHLTPITSLISFGQILCQSALKFGTGLKSLIAQVGGVRDG